MIKKAVWGFFYTAIGKYSNTLVQLLVNAVLSRILSPGDYGIVAVCQVFILFFGVLNDAGMGPAIIQNKSLSARDHSVLFNYSLAFAFVSAILYGLLGNVLSIIYNNNIYVTLTWFQSLYVFFAGANVVPTALLNLNQDFKRLNYSLLIGNVVGGVVGVLSAIGGLGIYSLVTSVTASSIVIFILNFYKSRIKITNDLSIMPVKSIWKFAKNQFGFNFLNFFSRNSDSLLIGKFLGPVALGNYSKAYQVLLMPNSILLGVINPVLQPILSSYQDDVEYIRKVYFKFLKYLAFLSLPLSVFLSLSAREVIFFLFGNQWSKAVFPFSVLGLTVWIQVTSASTPAIYQARNKTNSLLVNGYQTAFFVVGSIIMGIIIGDINSLSVVLSIGFLLSFFANFYILCTKVLQTKLTAIFKEFKIAVEAAIIVMILLELYKALASIKNIFVDLLIRTLLLALSMITVLIVNKEFKKVVCLIKK